MRDHGLSCDWSSLFLGLAGHENSLCPVFIRQPRPVEADVLGGIGDGDGFLVDDRQRTRVVGGD